MKTKLYIEDSIIIDWSDDWEFGSIHITNDDLGNIVIDSEYTGKEFVKRVLENLVDNATVE